MGTAGIFPDDAAGMEICAWVSIQLIADAAHRSVSQHPCDLLTLDATLSADHARHRSGRFPLHRAFRRGDGCLHEGDGRVHCSGVGGCG